MKEKGNILLYNALRKATRLRLDAFECQAVWVWPLSDFRLCPALEGWPLGTIKIALLAILMVPKRSVSYPFQKKQHLRRISMIQLCIIRQGRIPGAVEYLYQLREQDLHRH